MQSMSSAESKECTESKVRKLLRELDRQYEAQMSRNGLRVTQYRLLSQLAMAGPVRPTDLAKELKMAPSTLSRCLGALETAGWISIDEGSNRRDHLISMTAAGREMRANATRHWKAAQRALADRVGEENVLRLHLAIDSMLALLDESGIAESSSSNAGPHHRGEPGVTLSGEGRP